MGGPLQPAAAEAAPALVPTDAGVIVTAQAVADQLVGHAAQLLGSLIAIAIGCADGFTRARWGAGVDLGFIVLGLGGLGLQAGGILPR